MTDDFCLVALSEEKCKADMSRVVDMLSKCGFVFNEDKFQMAQQIVFIGFLVDSTSMTVSFHPSRVAAYLYVLRDIVSKISKGKRVAKDGLESLGVNSTS